MKNTKVKVNNNFHCCAKTRHMLWCCVNNKLVGFTTKISLLLQPALGGQARVVICFFFFGLLIILSDLDYLCRYVCFLQRITGKTDSSLL